MEIKYKLIYFRDALKDIEYWKRSGNKAALKKIDTLLDSLEQNPRKGPGSVEELKYQPGVWSRRINQKDRITYTISEEKKLVIILRMRGHYEDK